MRVLVIGQGGREHALCWKLKQSQQVKELYCAPGNAGIAEVATCLDLAADDIAGLIEFAKTRAIELSVVGPEKPLLDGIVDAFEAAGLRIVGPNRKAALLEGSKSFAKALMEKYQIPSARYQSFDELAPARAYLKGHALPVVIKADGLAAGKGVVIAHERGEADTALMRIMEERAFGDAGTRVVIEEYLMGQELSLLAFVDGETVRPMVPAQDHKPVFNGDRGPNTGGMGAYSPVPQFSERDIERALETILKPVARAMVAEGRPFKGVLYAGLMLTPSGPKVIEFNVRFGDPEAQVVLPRLNSDLAEVLFAVSTGTLAKLRLEWSEEAAVCVVMASPGYPGGYPKGLSITGLAGASDVRSAHVFHAGTRLEGDQLLSSGGRVLGVTGLGQDIASARERAYDAVKRIRFAGAHYRTDIAMKALVPERGSGHSR